MQQVSRNCLIIAAIVCSGIVARHVLPSRQTPRLRSAVLARFPHQLGGFTGVDVQDPDAVETRDSYRPAAIVYRDYSSGAKSPIQLFVAPVPAGVHSPAYCLRYNGWMVTHQSEAALKSNIPVTLSQIVSISPAGETDACSYYWRTGDAAIHDSPLRLWLKQKLAILGGSNGDPTFLVEMCMQIKDQTQAGPAFSRLSDFAEKVDPVVAELFADVDQVSRTPRLESEVAANPHKR